MPTRNQYYRDPALAQAFNNLAGMFAPPSGSDLAGYATARAKRDEASRLAELFNYAKNPDYNREQFDRLGIAAGRYNPNQSYYSVDQGNATQRYGVDVGAQTSRMNNAADNAAKLRIADGNNRTTVVGQMFQPLNPGQVRPAVPGEIAGNFGLPELPMETGVPKPMSEAEVKGAERQDLRAKGLLTDQQILESVVGSQAPVQALGPDGKPRFMSPGAAVTQGAQPAPSAAQKPSTFVAVLPDGTTRVPAVQNPDGTFRHAQTGEPLPTDITIFDVPRAQGSAADVGMGTTANRTRAQAMRAQVTNTNKLIQDLDGLVRSNPAASGLAANILSFAQDAKQVVKELGASFGGDPNSPVSEGQLKAVAERFLPQTGEGYNPVYREVRSKLLELAYANARMNNPSGEVSRFALEREIEALGLGTVGNDQSVLTVLKSAAGRMERTLAEADVLEGRAPAPSASGLFRPGGPNGAAPAAAPGAPAPRVRMRFDAEGNPVQ